MAEQPGQVLNTLQSLGCTVLADGDPCPVIALPVLLQAPRLDALLLHLYGPQLLSEHQPVLVSQWAKYAFMQLIPAVVVAALAHDWHWPLRLEQVALGLSERGTPDAVKFLAPGALRAVTGVAPLSRFDGLLDELLTPFIDALSTYGGLPRVVLWSSAGDALDTCLSRLDASLAQGGWPLLSQPRRADGRRNPLYQTITYAPQRQRRACCLSHRVAWVGRCEHCPLPS